MNQIKINNWSVLDYNGALYNIVELKENLWSIETTIWMKCKGKKDKDQAFVLSFDMKFGSYADAFHHLQSVGPILYNTMNEVAVINRKGEALGVLDLSKNIKFKERYVHEAHKTLN